MFFGDGRWKALFVSWRERRDEGKASRTENGARAVFCGGETRGERKKREIATTMDAKVSASVDRRECV